MPRQYTTQYEVCYFFREKNMYMYRQFGFRDIIYSYGKIRSIYKESAMFIMRKYRLNKGV